MDVLKFIRCIYEILKQIDYLNPCTSNQILILELDLCLLYRIQYRRTAGLTDIPCCKVHTSI